MKKGNTLKLIPVLITSCVLHAQEKVELYNTGEMFVSANEVLFVSGEFVNSAQGDFVNSGDIYFLDDFSNTGAFVFSRSVKASQVFFEQLSEAKAKQKISGGANSTLFEDVIFNSNGIDLENEISIAGKAYFERGHVVVNTPLSGSITFLESSSVEGVGDESHVVGMADLDAKKEMEMPVGDGTYYRPITLGESSGLQNLFQTQYKRVNPLVGRAHNVKNAIIDINNEEYWEVKNEASNGAVILTLSWNEQTTPSFLLTNPEKSLHIVRWDDKGLKWEDLGGIVDVSTKTVKTPIVVEAQGIFTLALVDSDYNSELKIYNAVSPDGDGKNDYFIIENIDKYPNNSVQIVNRWGSKVYDTTKYDPTGDGNVNVFRGKAEGKGVLLSGNLPSGTYYYIVKYEVRTAKGSEWITKTGYLHLENN
ncbi:gliding motility-associated C-terminal domain-containing protein [Myroides odoratimimus]|uniref:gliding motility-associated C-terminal domain-containing protein n=1 Tax=Myroides odoratimimus TaxID=76832 RepID=UPI0025791A3C|nr:gliding motility-associated C-terminal domain-containing protein [Myroides odoratimimus]MDM1058999.1 gliding motility-associated C-terminal domain-containing protein [Myroides odoratimimus]